jgi:hypothetical protein
MHAVAGAAALALWGTAAAAAPLTWVLSLDDGTPFGSVDIDTATGAITGTISGMFGTYSGSGSGHPGSPDMIGGYPVQDHFRLFDPVSGTTFFQDYGNGETYTHRVNEVAIEFGTLGAALSPLRGTFAVIFREIVNYDESYTYCVWYEDLYDENGEWIGQGGCAMTDSYSYYNIGFDETYTGTMSPASPTPPPAPVPLPAGAVLLAGGLLALAAVRRRR